MNLHSLIEKAQHSAFWLWVLNKILHRTIPFNKPHAFWVNQFSNRSVELRLPYKKANLNHIKGIHACALATASEYASGLCLLLFLGFKKYRIIMQKMEMEYHYQGKTSIVINYQLPEDFNLQSIENQLEKTDSLVQCCEVIAVDEHQNHISTGKIYWQIKPWSRVKTKLN